MDINSRMRYASRHVNDGFELGWLESHDPAHEFDVVVKGENPLVAVTVTGVTGVVPFEPLNGNTGASGTLSSLTLSSLGTSLGSESTGGSGGSGDCVLHSDSSPGSCTNVTVHSISLVSKGEPVPSEPNRTTHTRLGHIHPDLPRIPREFKPRRCPLALLIDMAHSTEAKSRIETTGPVQPCARITRLRTRPHRASDMPMAAALAASAYSHNGLGCRFLFIINSLSASG